LIAEADPLANRTDRALSVIKPSTKELTMLPGRAHRVFDG
jgi:hypothetical protein